MPNLLTNLRFTEQAAAILENGNIRIEDQNYGFDLEKGIKEVLLELDAERYYMIVKMLKWQVVKYKEWDNNITLGTIVVSKGYVIIHFDFYPDAALG